MTSAGRPRRDRDARPATASSAAERPDSITTPLDRTHRDSVTALHTIREAFTQAHQRVATWQPAPYPGLCLSCGYWKATVGLQCEACAS